jgi:hypothetical protein
LEEYAQAEAHVREGRPNTLMEVRYPLPYFVTAAGYVDKYGPAERYNILHLVDRVSCPALYTYGSVELEGMAFRGLPEELESASEKGANLQVAVIAGGDHLYSGVVTELVARLQRAVARR